LELENTKLKKVLTRMLSNDEKHELAQHWFTLEFKNADIEREFLEENKDRTLSFAKVVIAEIATFKAVDIVFHGKDCYDGLKPYNSLVPAGIMAIFTVLCLVFYFMASRRYLKVQVLFNAVMTPVVSAFLIEKAVLYNDARELTLALPRQVLQIAVLSLIGSNQIALASSYAIVYAYLAARNHAVLQFQEWLRSQTYFMIIFLAIFILAHVHTRYQREGFVRKLQSRQVQALFQGLVGVFHDGILISHNEDVIFKNR